MSSQIPSTPSTSSAPNTPIPDAPKVAVPKLLQSLSKPGSRSIFNVQSVVKYLIIGLLAYLFYRYMSNVLLRFFRNFVTMPKMANVLDEVVETERRRLESLVRTERVDRDRLIAELRTEMDNFREELDEFRESFEDDSTETTEASSSSTSTQNNEVNNDIVVE